MTCNKTRLCVAMVLCAGASRAGRDRPVGILGVHQHEDAHGARRRSESGRLGGTSPQRSGHARRP